MGLLYVDIDIMNVNLMPWRLLLAKRKKHRQITLHIGCLVLNLIVVMMAQSYLGKLIHHQTARNSYLEKEIQQAAQSIEAINAIQLVQQQVRMKLALFQSWQTSRSVNPRVLFEVARMISKRVVLTELQRHEQAISVHGQAESKRAISNLLRAIEANHWLTRPQLMDMKQVLDKEVFHIVCDCNDRMDKS